MNPFSECHREFSRDGFVKLTGYLTRHEVQNLEEHLQRYIRETAPGLPPTDVFYEVEGRPETLKQMQKMQRHDTFFQSLTDLPKFTRLAEALLGMPVVLNGVELFNKPARIGKPTPAHQDGYYFCLVPSQAVTLWFPLDPVSEENGCIRYVKGSHKKGIRNHRVSNILGFSQGLMDWGPEDEAAEVKALASPGDLLAHHCDIIHRADANPSPRSRRALAIVYYAASAGVDEVARARYRQSSMAQRVKLQSGQTAVTT
jgi:phytanoyl-CoA hydroxylase